MQGHAEEEERPPSAGRAEIALPLAAFDDDGSDDSDYDGSDLEADGDDGTYDAQSRGSRSTGAPRHRAGSVGSAASSAALTAGSRPGSRGVPGSDGIARRTRARFPMAHQDIDDIPMVVHDALEDLFGGDAEPGDSETVSCGGAHNLSRRRSPRPPPPRSRAHRTGAIPSFLTQSPCRPRW